MRRFRTKRFGILFLTLAFIIMSACGVQAVNNKSSISYQTHVQNVGWQEAVADGQMSGSEGKSLRLEGIKIQADDPDLELVYQTHIQNIGWEADTNRGWKKDGQMSGTEGLSYRLEAIEIQLEGKNKDQYDVYYQVHAQNFGWLGWAKNGESSGTAGYAYRLEGIRIELLPAGSEPPTDITKKAFFEKGKTEESESPEIKGNLKVSYIDVGQGDCVLVQQDDQAMLIDAGNRGDGDQIKTYIENQGVSVLDYVIATHPHADHIGAMDYIINSFKIGKVYMPEVTTNTQTFERLVVAMTDKGLKANKPVVGESFMLGDATCEIMGPMAMVSGNLNSYSIVLRITYGDNRFLFTGDAEDMNERAMVEAGLNLASDVLYVGHHGSNTSSIPMFLDAVNPQSGVISCGQDNKYGHPDQTVLNRLNERDIQVFQTNLNGTIVARSDGKTINFNTNPIVPPIIPPVDPIDPVDPPNDDPVDPVDYTVYKTKSGTKYHREGCRYLPSTDMPLLKSEAISQGLTPCKVCKP